MDKETEMTPEKESRRILGESSEIDFGGGGQPPFEDNRPGTMQLKQMQEGANKSPQVLQLKALQKKVNQAPMQLTSFGKSKTPRFQQTFTSRTGLTGIMLGGGEGNRGTAPRPKGGGGAGQGPGPGGGGGRQQSVLPTRDHNEEAPQSSDSEDMTNENREPEAREDAGRVQPVVPVRPPVITPQDLQEANQTQGVAFVTLELPILTPGAKERLTNISGTWADSNDNAYSLHKKQVMPKMFKTLIPKIEAAKAEGQSLFLGEFMGLQINGQDGVITLNDFQAGIANNFQNWRHNEGDLRVRLRFLGDDLDTEQLLQNVLAGRGNWENPEDVGQVRGNAAASDQVVVERAGGLWNQIRPQGPGGQHQNVQDQNVQDLNHDLQTDERLDYEGAAFPGLYRGNKDIPEGERKVRLGGGSVVDPEQVAAKMQEALTRLNEIIQDPIAPDSIEHLQEIINRAIEIHTQIINIHPFKNGNGRVARVLMNVILMANGLPAVRINHRSPSYKLGAGVARQHDDKLEEDRRDQLRRVIAEALQETVRIRAPRPGDEEEEAEETKEANK